MRGLIALALSVAVVVACGGGGSYGSPIEVSPAVTSAPRAPASASYAPDYGY